MYILHALAGLAKQLEAVGSSIEFVGWAALGPNNLTTLSALGSPSGTGDGGTIAEGDVVLVLYGYNSNTTRNFGMSTAGYTSIADQAGANHTRAGAFYKVMGPTPDTEALTVYTGNSQDAQAGGVIVLRGVDTTALATAIVQTDTTLNPSAITPTVAGSQIFTFVMAASVASTGEITVAKGANMTLVGTHGGVNVHSAGCAIAYEPWTSGAFDPDTFTTGGVGTFEAAISISVVVEPA